MLAVQDHYRQVCDLKGGDILSFDAFYYQFYQPVFRNIVRFIHQYDIAEDILQEVFLALWEHREELDPNRPVDAWLFVVSYNKSINWLKQNNKLKTFTGLDVVIDYSSDEVNLEEQVFQSQVALLNDAVDKLPLRKRQAFRLCKLEGRSYEEAGQLLGISSDTVREYVKTALQSIRRYIATQPASPTVMAISCMFLLLV